jgi:hypothetical protein
VVAQRGRKIKRSTVKGLVTAAAGAWVVYTDSNSVVWKGFIHFSREPKYPKWQEDEKEQPSGSILDLTLLREQDNGKPLLSFVSRVKHCHESLPNTWAHLCNPQPSTTDKK